MKMILKAMGMWRNRKLGMAHSRWKDNATTQRRHRKLLQRFAIRINKRTLVAAFLVGKIVQFNREKIVLKFNAALNVL